MELSKRLQAVAGLVTAGSVLADIGTDHAYIPIWLAGAAVIFAVIIGMVAGFFPSRRAMKLSPLAAIRNE